MMKTNVDLIKRYVALKAIKTVQTDLFLQELKKAVGEDQTEKVMEMPLAALPRELRKFVQEKICRRYNLTKRLRLFRQPTIGQWIANITAIYTPEDIIAYFSQETGISAQCLAKAKIGGQIVTRPYLISLVEKLETATGRSLILPESDTPLAYLGNDITFGEIAHYFAASSEVISRLRRRYCKENRPETQEERLEIFRKCALEVYRRTAEIDEGVSDEDILSYKVKSIHPQELTPDDWDLPIFWAEDELKIQIYQLSEKINADTTVSDLLDIMVNTKELEFTKKSK